MPVLQAKRPQRKQRRHLFLSLDTETTGLDFVHGSSPFIVSIAHDDVTYLWRWEVNPLTRQPIFNEEDWKEIVDLLLQADGMVFHNAKFDLKVLMSTPYVTPDMIPWNNLYCTLLAGHLLASNQPKDLTTMCQVYLGINIKPQEDLLDAAAEEARRYARSAFPEWRIAIKGMKELPSAKGTLFKNDLWLPRAVAVAENWELDHPWYTVAEDYAAVDPTVTLMLHKETLKRIQAKELEKIYNLRRKIIRINWKIESNGVTLSSKKLDSVYEQFEHESQECNDTCVAIAESYGHELVLPKSGNNTSLTQFVFGYETLPDKDGVGGGEWINNLGLPSIKSSKKTGKPSLDKASLEHYEATLDPESVACRFVTSLKDKRKRDTALSYMESYRRFWTPISDSPGYYRLYPSINPTGSDTLRWTSSNPNAQNISKQEGFSLRVAFGPAPGREWWSLDANNIELRLPAYEAGETEMIMLFERPNDPPYYGSNHLLVFDILHPQLFAEHGKNVKKLFASTWYQWVKNGNFAVQYGAMEESGTSDRAYHVKGAHARIKSRFSKIAALNDQMIEYANRHGYVETIPDRSVDPSRGYPIQCSTTSWGKISPTVPLNYHIQSSAMWWMGKAMIRCQDYLDEVNAANRGIMGEYMMIMQIHDELVFDFPKGTGPKPWLTNLPKIRKIKYLMEQGGVDYGIPTPVSCSYHPDNWGSESFSL